MLQSNIEILHEQSEAWNVCGLLWKFYTHTHTHTSRNMKCKRSNMENLYRESGTWNGSNLSMKIIL